jgi:SAM-dependent methyltransferase
MPKFTATPNKPLLFMNRAQYEAMLHTEDRYWWFRGRRKVISRFLSQMGLGENPDILEVGCGGGGNLLMLSRFSRHIKAVEPNPVLREHALQRDICEVAEGTLPDNIPFKAKNSTLSAFSMS